MVALEGTIYRYCVSPFVKEHNKNARIFPLSLFIYFSFTSIDLFRLFFYLCFATNSHLPENDNFTFQIREK